MLRQLNTDRLIVGLKVLLVVFGFSAVLLAPQTVFAGGGVGTGGAGGGTGGGPWGWTTYGNGWALYSSTGSGPSATPKINSGSWATASSTCSSYAKYVALYILGTGVDKGAPGYPKANGNYMGYAYRSSTGASSAWGASGPNGNGLVDHGTALTISASAATTAYSQLGSYDVDTTGFTFGGTGGTVAWFCYGIYPTDVYPFVAPASSSVVRGNPVTFTLERTVQNYTGPTKTAHYSVSYSNSPTGTFSNIPTTVSSVFDNTITTPLNLTISKDLNKSPIVPNLTFPATAIPSTWTQICVRMRLTGTEPPHVNYKGNPHTACTSITPPLALPWSISGVSKAVKNGTTVGAAGALIHAVAGDTIKFRHALSNSSSSASASPAINYVGVNSNATAAGLVLPAGATGSLNIGQSTAGLDSGTYTIQIGDVGKTFCQAIDYNPSSDSNAGHSQSTAACITVDPPSVACTQTLSTNPTRIQPGDIATYIRLAFPSLSVPQSLTYSIPGVVSSATVAIAAGQGTYDITNVTMPNAANDYAATWSVSGATGNCSGTVSVVDMPYFSVYGASVRAGGDFTGGTCTGGGTLAAWRNYSGGSNYGAGTQLSAIALLAITGYASKNIAPYSNPVQLSFANTAATSNSSDSPKLGGAYSTSYCMVAPEVPPTGVTDIGGSGTISLTGQNGALTKTGNLTINTSTVGVGNNVSVFVTGNVYIAGNISYASGWASSSDVPSAVIVATGDIYIDPSVTNIDGLFVSKKDIITCANASGAISATGLFACNKQLVVHGSFVAKNIRLLRALGTLKDDAAHSNVGCHNNGGISSSRGTCAAEVFDFSPEIYLSQPAIKKQSNGALRYHSIVTLPPIL